MTHLCHFFAQTTKMSCARKKKPGERGGSSPPKAHEPSGAHGLPIDINVDAIKVNSSLVEDIATCYGFLKYIEENPHESRDSRYGPSVSIVRISHAIYDIFRKFSPSFDARIVKEGRYNRIKFFLPTHLGGSGWIDWSTLLGYLQVTLSLICEDGVYEKGYTSTPASKQEEVKPELDSKELSSLDHCPSGNDDGGQTLIEQVIDLQDPNLGPCVDSTPTPHIVEALENHSRESLGICPDAPYLIKGLRGTWYNRLTDWEKRLSQPYKEARRLFWRDICHSRVNYDSLFRIQENVCVNRSVLRFLVIHYGALSGRIPYHINTE